MYEFNGIFDTLTQRLQSDLTNAPSKIKKTYTFSLVQGYNKIKTAPFKVYKNMSICVDNNYMYYNLVEIDTSGDAIYSDYNYMDYFFSISSFARLDPIVNQRYYVRALINDDYNHGYTKITKKYLVAKNYTINVELVKDDFNAHASQFVEIYKGCAQPNITIEQYYTQYNPFQIVRSKLFTLTSITYVECDTAYTTEYTWTATILNSTDFQPIRTFALATITNTKIPTLVVLENTIDYGLYQFKLDFIVRYGIAGSKHKSAEAVTYYEILPTGIAVFAIDSGVTSVKIGSGQLYMLKPTLFTIDFDYLMNPNKLDYKYYCRTIDLTNSFGANSSMTDLQTLKLLNPPMNRNVSCFGSGSILKKKMFNVKLEKIIFFCLR